jgi:addiction module HigA family antidote
MLFDPPIHPGEVLREEFLEPAGIKPYTLAVRLGIQRSRVERVVAGTNPVTPDTALRLARMFGTTPQFWLNMQAAYDLAVAEKEIAAELEHIVPEPTPPVPQATRTRAGVP